MKIQAIVWISVLTVCSLWQSCVEADLPPPVSGEPVFYLQGALDGNDLQLAGGLDDREMVPSTATGAGNVIEYQGTFVHRAGDIVYPDFLRIGIRSGVQSPQAINPAADLAPGWYPFNRSGTYDSTLVQVTFHSQVEMGFPPYVYRWEFDNGWVSEAADPVVIFNPQQPFQRVKLEVWDVFGKHASYESDFATSGEPLRANFSTSPSLTDVVVSLEVSGGVPPYISEWNITNSTGTVFSMPASNALLDSVCLSVSDQEGNATSLCKTLADPSTGSLFSAIYTYDVQPVVPDWQLSTAVITLADQNGQLFSSDLGEQPAAAYFEILDAQPYPESYLGKPVYRLQLRFHCLLFDQDGAARTMTGEGYIAVGLP